MDNSCVLPVQQSGSSCFLKKQEWRNKAVSPGRRKTLGFWSCPFVQVLYLIQFKLLLNSLDKMIRMTLFIRATGKKRFDSQKHLEFQTQFQLKSVENLLTLKRQKKKKKRIVRWCKEAGCDLGPKTLPRILQKNEFSDRNTPREFHMSRLFFF